MWSILRFVLIVFSPWHPKPKVGTKWVDVEHVNDPFYDSCDVVDEVRGKWVRWHDTDDDGWRGSSQSGTIRSFLCTRVRLKEKKNGSVAQR